MPGSHDIPDIPDPSATEAPQQFGSELGRHLEPEVFEPQPSPDASLEEDDPTDVDTKPKLLGSTRAPTPAPVQKVSRPPAVPAAPQVPPAATPPPAPAPVSTDAGVSDEDPSPWVRMAVFFVVVAVVVFLILSVAFGGATVFGLVLGVILR